MSRILNQLICVGQYKLCKRIFTMTFDIDRFEEFTPCGRLYFKPVPHDLCTRWIYSNRQIWRVVWQVFNRKARRLFSLAESIAVSRPRRVQHPCNYIYGKYVRLTINWRAHDSRRSNIIVKRIHRKWRPPSIRSERHKLLYRVRIRQLWYFGVLLVCRKSIKIIKCGQSKI